MCFWTVIWGTDTDSLFSLEPELVVAWNRAQSTLCAGGLGDGQSRPARL